MESILSQILWILHNTSCSQTTSKLCYRIAVKYLMVKSQGGIYSNPIHIIWHINILQNLALTDIAYGCNALGVGWSTITGIKVSHTFPLPIFIAYCMLPTPRKKGVKKGVSNTMPPPPGSLIKDRHSYIGWFYATFYWRMFVQTTGFPTMKVVPLFKGGDRTAVENYRLISLLPLSGNILEKISHKTSNNIFFPNNILAVY